jgi:hypothetical protein
VFTQGASKSSAYTSCAPVSRCSRGEPSGVSPRGKKHYRTVRAIACSLRGRSGAATNRVVREAQTTAFYFIRRAMTGFTANAFLSRNRVSPKEAFEGLELCERELSCTVPRGLDGSNPVRLLGHARNRLQTPSEASSFLQAGRKLSRWCNGRSCRPWIDQNAA